MQKMAGQSSVELLVSAAVIVPLLLLIPTLANILLVQTEAHKAARHVAWERIAYPEGNLKNAAAYESEITQRFLRYSKLGFGASASVADGETDWSDFGRQTDAVTQRRPHLVDYDSGVKVDVAGSRSATAGYANASAWLANRGGPNGIQLDTLQTGELSIGIRGDSSLLAGALSSPSLDPVSGEPRFFVRSSSALVADSWTPPNDAAFHDRVGGIGRGLRNFAGFHGSLTNWARPIFRELDDHMFVSTPGTDSPFDMVDPEQSTRLPPYVRQP